MFYRICFNWLFEQDVLHKKALSIEAPVILMHTVFSSMPMKDGQLDVAARLYK